jgi:negative regulator of genetic competence, sporulation and motility
MGRGSRLDMYVHNEKKEEEREKLSEAMRAFIFMGYDHYQEIIPFIKVHGRSTNSLMMHYDNRYNCLIIFIAHRA